MKYKDISKFEIIKDEKETDIFNRYIIDFYEEHFLDIKESDCPIITNFNDIIEFFPHEFMIIENFTESYDELINLFYQVMKSWCGKKRKLFFEVPDKFFSKEEYFNLTSDYINKVIKIKANVDVINQYEDISQGNRITCQDCGHEMIERKFKYNKCVECKSLKLGRLPFDFVSRRHIELSDPNQTEGSCVIESYIDVYSKKDRTIFPQNLIGQDIEALGILRLEMLPFKRYRRKFEIIGIKLDKYKGLKKAKIKEIIEKVKKDKNAFINIALSMNKDVKGMDYVKFILFAVCVGLKYPDKQFGSKHLGVNVMIIGSPAIAKSNIMENFTKYFYKARKSTAKSLSKAGALGGVDITKEKRTISAGEISRCNDGVLFIDECKHLADEVKAGLLTSMSDGWHTLKYAGINFKFKYNTNIVLIGNPKFGELEPNTPLKDQVDFDPELISRCIITMMPTSYIQEENGGINIERLQEVFEIRRLNNEDNIKNQKQKYDDKFLLDYATTVKTFPNPEINKKEEIMIENYIKTFAENQNMNGTFHNSENHQKGKVDLRMIDALKILTKVIARAEFSSKVLPRHVELMIDVYQNTMIKFRQIYKMDTPDVIEEKMYETNKKKYPKSEKDKIYFILESIPKEPLNIEWVKVLETVIEHGISERDFEELITKLIKIGEVGEPRKGLLMRYKG